MYLDFQYSHLDHSVINSDSLSSYQIEYSDGFNESSILSRYAFSCVSSLYKWDSRYSPKDFLSYNSGPYDFDAVDKIFSSVSEQLNIDPVSGYCYSTPHFIEAKAVLSSSISMEKFSENYSKSLQSVCPTSSYPIATRYVSSDGTIFVERPPFQATVDYKPSGASSHRKKLPPITIWIPWTIYSFNPLYPGSGSYMYFSHKSLTSMSDNYYPTFLPNTYQDGRVCYSNSLNDLPLDQSNLTPASMYSYMINEFFAGSWNSDLMNPWSYFYTSIINPLLNREKSLEIFSTIPHLHKLFFPDSETIEKSGLNKITKIYNVYKNYGAKRFFSYLSYEYFHYAFLSIISTFSLTEVLACQEEIDMMAKDLSTKAKDSIYFTNDHHYLSSHVYSFKKISTKQASSSYSLNSNYIRGIINKACADNMTFPEYTFFNKNIIFANAPAQGNPMAHFRNILRYSKGLQINEAVLSSENCSAIIYNYPDSSMYFVTSEMNSTQMYLEMLRTYTENNYFLPLSSTSSYQILSQDEYVKL